MEFIMQLHLLITLTIISKVLTDRIYLQSVVGLSNRWYVYTSPGSTSLPWKYDDVGVQWEVCLSNNSILQTEFYSLPKFLTSVYADITVNGRKCDKIQNALGDCEQTMAVGAYLSDDATSSSSSSSSSSQSPPKQNKDFIELPRTPQTSDFSKWTETIELSNLGGKKYIQYLFGSKNFCGSLRNFTVYYYTCTTLNSFATFKTIIAPVKNNGTIRVTGQCVGDSNSLTRQPPYFDCTWNGTGTVVGPCVCNKGFTNVASQCEACSSKEYKASDGNEPCDKCGVDSLSNAGRTLCSCKYNFYREKSKELDDGSPCYELPKNPEIVNQTEGSTEVYIEWKHTNQYPGKYIIICSNCPTNKIFPTEVTSNSVTINGLGSFAEYELELEFENNVTKLIDKRSFKTFEVKTKPGKPGAIRHLKQTTTSNGSVTLKWDPPFAKGSNNPEYIISHGSSSARTFDTEFKIENGVPAKSFTITVEVVVNGERLTGPTFTVKEEVKVKGGVSLDIAIGAGIGAVILVVVIAIVAICIWRKKSSSEPLEVVYAKDVLLT